MSIFLCGNTGIKNRGCEAIIRATVGLLPCSNGEITLASFNKKTEYPLTKELGINFIQYNNYPNRVYKLYSAAIRRLFGSMLFGLSYIEKTLFSRLSQNDICLTIGGDTYCYNRPVIAFALNEFAQNHGIKNVLWCCSIGKKNLTPEKIKDLAKYDRIFAREIITYNNLVNAGVPKNNVVKCCDPAFFLRATPTSLPTGFITGNTIGINLSQMVINSNNENAYKNVVHLINYILDYTEYHICLIPHVYDLEDPTTNDYEVLNKLYQKYKTNRISIVSEELNCEQLKYIISKCEFFIGARTHSTIAAYSSFIPTLVLGYSVKSKGIATDLFGTYTGYVLPYDELNKEDELTSAFLSLISRKQEIKDLLKKRIPEYKKELIQAINSYFSDYHQNQLCADEICTGCSACYSACSFDAISMVEDDRGFLHPIIDNKKCIHCGKCSHSCPVLNRIGDDNRIPQTYLCINRDREKLQVSSSGGVFIELAESVLKENGYVSAAAYDNEYKRVEHRLTNRRSDLLTLCGSKYVQSDMRTVFRDIRDKLDSGIKILFVGTPCQVEGLKSYLKQEYENLLCVDFICHGVPSPRVFKKYLSELENYHQKRIADIFMRSKKIDWRNYGIKVIFDDSTELFEFARDNLYMRGYLNELFTRSSCHSCAFKKIHRESDITLGDAWGVTEGEETKMGASVVFVHTEKGRRFLCNLSEELKLQEILFEDVIASNKVYLNSYVPSPLSAYFFDYLNSDKGVAQSINKCVGASISSKARRYIIKMRSVLGR